MKSRAKKTLLIFGALLLLLVATGAALLSSKNIQKKLLPSLTQVQSLQVAIVYDTAHVSGKVGVRNPLPLNITIDSLSYTILHQNDTLGKGTRNPETTLQSKNTTFVPVKLGIDFDLLNKKVKQLQKQDSTKLDLNLDLFFNVPLLGHQKIEVDKALPVKVPKMPVISVHSMRVVDFGLGKGVEMEMKLKFQNNNLEDLRVSDISYTVNAGDFLDAQEKLTKTYVIKGGQTSIHAVPLHLGIKEAAKAKIKKHFGDKTWEVNVSGSANIQSDNPMLRQLTLRFSQVQTVDVTKTGQAGKADEEKKKDQDDDKGLLKKIKEKVF